MIDEIMEGSMRILYESTITSIGSSVQGLLDEKYAYFWENAPEELKNKRLPYPRKTALV